MKKSKNTPIQQSMDDVTKDKIILVDTKGNTLGEIDRKQSEPQRQEKKPAGNVKSVVRAVDKATKNEVPPKSNYKKRRKLSLKERKKRRRRAIAAVIAEWVLGIAIVVICAVLFAFFFCRVKNIEVEGSTIYSEDDIKSYILDGKYSDNCVYDVVHNIFRPKKDIAFIENAKVKMSGLNTVKIVITERIPIGYIVEEGGLIKYFNEDGVITDISDIQLWGSTQWTGITPTGEKVKDVIVNDSVKLDSCLVTLKALKANDIFINEISVDDSHNIFGRKDDVKINFGLKNDIDDKCKRLSKILTQLENQSGTLHLENFSPENTDIVFKKES